MIGPEASGVKATLIAQLAPAVSVPVQLVLVVVKFVGAGGGFVPGGTNAGEITILLIVLPEVFVKVNAKDAEAPALGSLQ